MNILAFSNFTGSAQWRLQGIANYLNAKTDHEMFVVSSKEWNEDILGADVVIAQMWRNPKGVDVAHEQGAVVVYEADDIIIGVGGKDRKTLMELSPEHEEMTKETIGKCDLVTVTNEVIAKHYRQFNDNVVVLPNYLDFMWWGEPWKMPSTNNIRIGWMGSTSHREDLIMIEPVIKEILDKYENVKFVYCGTGGRKGIYGEELFKNLPPERQEYYIGVPLEYWSHKSKSLGLDIGIAPLLDDEFNSGKSAIKYYEYSANAVPGVYSDTVVYNKTIAHGHTGFLAKTQNDWIRYLEKLMQPDIHEQMTKDAYQDVINNYNLGDHYHKWIEVYERTRSSTSRSKSRAKPGKARKKRS
jgi:glycosyltransferase involved in cell wall biosynthesis